MIIKTLKTTALALSLAAASQATPAMADGHNDATDDITWVLILTLNEGHEDAFNALMAEMVAATREEEGTKTYEWYRNGDTVQILERYETNEDAGIHLGNFGANFAERFLTVLTPTGLTVYGPAEGGVREGLAGFGAVFHDQIGGFGG